MRICVLHSSYEGIDHVLKEIDDDLPNPGAFTSQHTFENRLIRKSEARSQIDAAVAEKFDFYINFMWGTYDDAVAGADESDYFESLGLPSAGITSWFLKRSKTDFFIDAKRRGSPSIPGTDKFPLFVKPAFGCSSLLIDEGSVCHNEQELQSRIDIVNSKMRPFRIQRAKGLGIENPEAYATSCEAAGRDSADLVVQEYIDGEDYAVDVIAMGDLPIPLSPRRTKHKQLKGEKQFLTYEAKADPGFRQEIICEGDNPVLYRNLQDAAVEAFITNKMHMNNMGCDVDIRAARDGKAFVIEVNPLPVAFYAAGSNFEDADVKRDLPGKYEAAVNIFITNYYLKHPEERKAKCDKVAKKFDIFAHKYDTEILPGPGDLEPDIKLLQKFNFGGSVLDLACGTGTMGQTLASMQKGDQSSTIKRLVGVDISNGMLDICRKSGLYTELHLERMDQFLARYNSPIDHILCIYSLQYLTMEELYFALARCFQLAQKSITFTVDEIPDAYNEALRRNDNAHMACQDHAESVKSFGEPAGWRLVYLDYHWAWKSPHTGVDVYTNFMRFERKVQVLPN